MANSTSSLEIAQKQFFKIADMLNLPDQIRLRLSIPRRTLEIKFVVEMDDKKPQLFYGWRSQHMHANVRGPAKGGIRYSPDLTKEEVEALTLLMSWKTALMGLKFIGGKGGVVCDPSRLSIREQYEITRNYVRCVHDFIGPDKDIPAPDMGTGERHMAWFADAYSQPGVEDKSSVVTGKPVLAGGTVGRTWATGKGLFVVTQNVANHLGMGIKGSRVAVQGLGNVGHVSAEEFFNNGATIVALSDIGGTIVDYGGINPYEVYAFVQKQSEAYISLPPEVRKTVNPVDFGATVVAFPGVSNKHDRSHVLEVECDILIPAATGRVINKDNAHKIKAKLISEGANEPTDIDADEILQQRGIVALPDILANGGGVTVSSFEYSQGKDWESWTEDRVAAQLTQVMETATEKTLALAQSRGVSLRQAANLIGIGRVAYSATVKTILPIPKELKNLLREIGDPIIT